MDSVEISNIARFINGAGCAIPNTKFVFDATTGIVILEAMAKGKAIIASAEGGPREMITDTVDGLLITPRAPEVLATAIRRLYANAEERGRLRSAALDAVG